MLRNVGQRMYFYLVGKQGWVEQVVGFKFTYMKTMQHKREKSTVRMEKVSGDKTPIICFPAAENVRRNILSFVHFSLVMPQSITHRSVSDDFHEKVCDLPSPHFIANYESPSPVVHFLQPAEVLSAEGTSHFSHTKYYKLQTCFRSHSGAL